MIDSSMSTAVSLMQRALALLDKSEDERAELAAARLQSAIDTAEGTRPMQDVEELDAEVEARFWSQQSTVSASSDSA